MKGTLLWSIPYPHFGTSLSSFPRVDSWVFSHVRAPNSEATSAHQPAHRRSPAPPPCISVRQSARVSPLNPAYSPSPPGLRRLRWPHRLPRPIKVNQVTFSCSARTTSARPRKYELLLLPPHGTTHNNYEVLRSRIRWTLC